MNDNFEEISKNIFLLRGKRSCNIYYLDFEKKAVVDTGHGDEIESIVECFKTRGIELTNIDYIINTHSHGDHVGGNNYLKKLNQDIKIVASEKEETYQKVRRSIDLLKGAEEEFEEYIIDIPVKDGDVIDLGNTKIKILYTPGHTIDSISLYLESFNILFTGDLIYPQVVTQLDYYQDLNKSIEELIESYNKVKELNADFYSGHVDPIKDTEKIVDHCIKKLKRIGKNKETILSNNMFPSIEFYIFKNKNVTVQKVKNYLVGNMLRFKDTPFFINIDESRFVDIVDKTIALMKLMNVIKIEDGIISLTGDVNDNIRSK